MCEECNVPLNTSSNNVDYAEHLNRVRDCAVYVELFAMTQNNRPYGSWGISCLEAAAMGKVVMTCHETSQVYREVYGETPLIISSDELEFKNNLMYLATHSTTKLKKATRKWVEDNHSYEATGNRVKQILESL